MTSNNLIVSDAEFIFAEKALIAYLHTMLEAGTQFNQIIDSVLANALQDPAISPQLQGLSDKMNEVVEKISLVSEALSGESQTFISEIDEKDQFVY
ncbi:hypothetical protein [Enterococcus wangshanyuanii]|uniref:Uncharacterized protein n=1 Tax=Enterococcus wangshanyuanii TaxID=2005703 RepID=A0ABQ1P6G8_9ENTE|nr:hypothetical protein [Enterococcus wangshanyuanii]GGC91043.1 hypothetical protein GCM10011573_20800 [Enterococcus wangshanyuanii]